ncbi:MAG: hypothetical protein EOO00_13200 [Chitinophagaceae bacterium]|nr:MAG: hypothetical protein EOO00_13200 [Chitinophagaceae bacterium]
MQKILRYLAMLLLIFCSLKGSAQVTVPTLAELVDSAILNDYILMNQRLAINQSELDKQELKDAFLPKLKISGSETFSLTTIVLKTNELEIPQLNISLDRATNRFTHTSDRLSLGADASMLLYSGGKIPLLRKAVEETSGV